MDELERLFLNTLEDLRAKIASPNSYEVLGAAWLVRKLFFEESPLVTQVNKKYRLKITFEVVKPKGFPGLPQPDYYFVLDGFDPEKAPGPVTPQRVNRDQLFALVLEKTPGHSHTLRELVLFEAHVMGAVHAGPPRTEKQKVLKAVSNSFTIGGKRPSLGQLQAIGRVVLKGLEPLKQAIESGGKPAPSGPVATSK